MGVTLQQLPIELLDSIFSRWSDDLGVTDNQRRDLRGLCKAFHKSLTPTAFRRIRLSEFDRDSFDRIVSISQSDLAKYVKTFEYKVVEHLNPQDIHNVDPFIQLDSGDIDKATVSAMARDLIERHQKYLGQLDVIGTFFDIISLVKALPAFIHLTTVLISYFDDTTADGPLGYREKDTAPTRAFWGVVKALQHCHFEIEILTIDAWHPMSLVRKVCSGLNPPWREEMWEEGEQWGTGISSDSDATGLPTRISPPGNHQIANVVGFLTSLTLSNIWPQRVELGWQKCILLDILMHCQRLEKLCIELVVPPGSARSGSLSGMLWARSEAYRKFVYPPLLCLKDLELKCGGDGAFLSTCLMPLFRGRNGTLKKLKLSGFYVKSNVVSRIEWDEYFGHLASDLRLEEVRLDKLKTSRGDMFYRSPEELRRWEGWLMHGPDAGTGTLWPRID